MKIQVHNLMKTQTYNLGIAYLSPYDTIALGFILFSVTISWHKELKKNDRPQ